MYKKIITLFIISFSIIKNGGYVSSIRGSCFDADSALAIMNKNIQEEKLREEGVSPEQTWELRETSKGVPQCVSQRVFSEADAKAWSHDLNALYCKKGSWFTELKSKVSGNIRVAIAADCVFKLVFLENVKDYLVAEEGSAILRLFIKDSKDSPVPKNYRDLANALFDKIREGKKDYIVPVAHDEKRWEIKLEKAGMDQLVELWLEKQRSVDQEASLLLS